MRKHEMCTRFQWDNIMERSHLQHQRVVGIYCKELYFFVIENSGS